MVGVNWLRSVRSTAKLCFVPVIVPPQHLESSSILENKLIGCADDSGFIVVVLSQGIRVALQSPWTVSSTRLVSDVIKYLGVTFGVWNWYTSKTKTMIVSWSRTMHLQPPLSTIDGTVLMASNDLNTYTVSGIWFQGDFWEASSLSFHSMQFLKGLVSLWSPGEYIQIDCVLIESLVFYFASFRCAVLHCVALLSILTLKTLDRVVSGSQFFNWWGCAWV